MIDRIGMVLVKDCFSDTEDGQVMNPASSWVEELEEKPEINEFGQIAPRRSINQSNLHHHHQQQHQQQQQQQQHQQQQGQNELGGNGSNGQGGSNMNGQGVNGGHNGGQIHQNHIQNQFQSNHPSSSWYPYSYPTNQNRDSFSSSLITYSENNNVIGIS